VRAMVHLRDTFEPDPEEHALYEALFSDIFQKIFPRLLPLYKTGAALRENYNRIRDGK